MSRTLIIGSGAELTCTADRLVSLEALELELSAAVDRMQAESLHQGGISRECAEQVHMLLQRARAL